MQNNVPPPSDPPPAPPRFIPLAPESFPQPTHQPTSDADPRRAICVHDWRHAGVRWWIDDSLPVWWIRYVDQFYCSHCLEVDSRPIEYRSRLGDLPLAPGTYAADSELTARLHDAALARVSGAAADPAPTAAGAPTPRED